MPRRRSDDRSSGDARRPYADRGGPEARHAETHDVRREAHTNPTGPEPHDESFDDDLAGPERTGSPAGHADESNPAREDKHLAARLDERLTTQETARLAVLEAGTRLQQGSVYLDLDDLSRGPFKALGGHEAGPRDRYIAKRDTDHELWNRLAGDGDAEVERPPGAEARGSDSAG